jgi:hypothetical protein
MSDISLQLLNYGVLGFFSLLMLSALVVSYREFKKLFDEERKQLKECREHNYNIYQSLFKKVDSIHSRLDFFESCSIDTRGLDDKK